VTATRALPLASGASSLAPSGGTATDKEVARTRQQAARRERQRGQLRRLAEDLARLRVALAGTRATARRLSEIEAQRPLSPDERRAAPMLVHETERLYYELRRLRRAFARLQEEPKP
jgi:hypothetical protein